MSAAMAMALLLLGGLQLAAGATRAGVELQSGFVLGAGDRHDASGGATPSPPMPGGCYVDNAMGRSRTAAATFSRIPIL